MPLTSTIEGCNKEHKHNWERCYRHAGKCSKKEFKHEIQFFYESLFPKIGLYMKFSIKENEVKNKLEQPLEQGVIQPSTLSSESPIIIMPKKDGTWNMYVDYKVLNKIRVNNRHSPPSADDLLDQLQKAKYLSKIYLS